MAFQPAHEALLDVLGEAVLLQQSDEFFGLSLQPAIRFLGVPEGSFGVGVGLRASIPLHHGCPYTAEKGAVNYARCALGKPVLLQLEVPFGVY